MKEIKDALDFSKERVQEHTNKIQNVINPIKPLDLPFLVYSMKTLTKALEAEMDAEQKEVVEGLRFFLGVEKRIIDCSTDTAKDIKVGGDK